jgi:hypothetical protein
LEEGNVDKQMNAEVNQLITRIIDLEWEMFSSLKALEPVACQQHPKTFRIMRWMSHSVHCGELLQSILTDLERARDEGRNLMTEKYARMENRIPPLKDVAMLAVIHEIADIEDRWMKPLREAYPLMFHAHSAGFHNYTVCELETYSDATVEAYHREIRDALDEDRNLLEERYCNLFGKFGYDSLQRRENDLRRWTESPDFRGC